jgi:hypothetical protein
MPSTHRAHAYGIQKQSISCIDFETPMGTYYRQPTGPLDNNCRQSKSRTQHFVRPILSLRYRTKSSTSCQVPQPHIYSYENLIVSCPVNDLDHLQLDPRFSMDRTGSNVCSNLGKLKFYRPLHVINTSNICFL